jgi:hypothetical protein
MSAHPYPEADRQKTTHSCPSGLPEQRPLLGTDTDRLNGNHGRRAELCAVRFQRVMRRPSRRGRSVAQGTRGRNPSRDDKRATRFR